MTLSIGLFMFPQMELLDFAGPYQVFAAGSRIQANATGEPEFELITIAATPDPVVARGGVRLLPDAMISDHPHLDCLILPGGLTGVDAQIDRGDVVPWIAAQADTVAIIASVGTGAFLLAQTGLLNGLQAITHVTRESALRQRFPAIDVVENRRWVDTGKCVTAAGLTAGIDMALHLVERLVSRDVAVSIARQMEM